MRYQFSGMFLVLLATLLSVDVLRSTWAAEQPPNVVLIFADDLGYGDVGCYGATKVKTPNIDRLAKEGRRFTDAHSVSAVCTPSRYALLTGEYPVRARGGQGVWGPAPVTSGLLVDTEKLTVADVFKSRGYHTAAFGKWHLGFKTGTNDWKEPLRPGPQDLGFDYYFGMPVVNSAPPYVYVENDRIVGNDPDDPLVFLGRNIKNATPITPIPPEAAQRSPNRFGGAKEAHKLYNDYQVGTTFAEKSVAWIEEHKDKPFFLYLATTNIHHPFTPAKRFQGTSECGLYGDYIHELDWMVAEILSCLDDNGLSQNTLVIFTSDNGGMFNHGGQAAFKHGHRINGDLLGFKFGVWEGGHRVPFIVRWPGKVKAGTTSGQLIGHVDMLATIAAATGKELEKDQQGDSVNMLPAFVGEPDQPIRDHLVLAPHKGTHLSVRQGKWMYIPARGSGGFTGRTPGDHTFAGPPAISFVGSVNSDIEDGKFKSDAAPAQLYDLESDVRQTRNVYREHPEVVQRLSALLKSYAPKPTARTPASAIGLTATKYDGFKPLGELRFTFESGELDGWSIVEGKAAQPVSGHASLPRHKTRPFYQQGKFHLSTGRTADDFSDKQQVVIQSPSFVIQGDQASFLASGGFDSNSLYVGLYDADSQQRLLAGGGPMGPQMKRTTWDVSKLRGRKVFLRVVDKNVGGWGHLTFDDFSVAGELCSVQEVTRSFLACGQKTYIMGADGKPSWTYPVATRDGYVLDDGTIILTLNKSRKYSGGAVVSIDAEGKETLIWKGTQTEVNSAQPTADGTFVITEAGPKPRLLEVNASGEVVLEFPLACQKNNHHMQTRMARKLPDGTFLAPHLLDFAVFHYGRDGKVLGKLDTTAPNDAERKIHTWPFTAIRHGEGHTLVCCTHGNRVVDFDAGGKIVWTLTNDDLPGKWLQDPCGAQVLPNGNIVITSYAAGRVDPQAPKLFEVTRDKKVVWKYADGQRVGIHHFQIITTNGEKRAGPALK